MQCQVKAKNLPTLILGNRAICKTVIIKQIPCQQGGHLTSENERRKKDLKNYAPDFSKLHTQTKYNILQQTNRYIIVQQLKIRNNTKKKIHFTYTGWFCL